MDVSKKLDQWEEAGLISAELKARIVAHEAATTRPVLLYAMLGLGAATVGLGIISVVAANWDGISDRLKLATDMLLALGLGAATFHVARRGMKLSTDVLVAVYYVFTLASIALLGQVYQLGAPTHEALLLWSAVTGPLLWLGQSRWLGALWCGGLTLTIGYAMEEVLRGVHGHRAEINVALTMGCVWLLALLTVTRGRVAHKRPHLAAGLNTGASIQLLLAGFMSTVPWYDRMRPEDVLGVGIAVCGLATIIGYRLLPWLSPQMPQRARQGVAVMLGLTWLSFALATGFERWSHDAIGALFQLSLLCALAWTHIHLGRPRTFNFLTGLIALRILIMYFEIFGSMLDTGIGMISGGGLTLLMAWLWRRKSPELARQLKGAGT